MKKSKRKIASKLVTLLSALAMVACFTLSIYTIEKFAKQDCFEGIEETTEQVSDMFLHSMGQTQDQLRLFADILASGAADTDERLETYLKNFCDTQAFSAACIHWSDGSTHSHGKYSIDVVHDQNFGAGIEDPSFVSDVYAIGERREDRFIYQSTPIIRSGQTVGILCGYISLDTFPTFISSAAYGGHCEFYIVDGDSGDFLMDEYHRYGSGETEIPLGNIYDGSMGERETKPGYHMADMCKDIAVGERGYFIFRSQRTGEWYYTYYTPMGINNWSMQLTIDEPTAFANYHQVRNLVGFLTLCAIIFSLCIVADQIYQSRQQRKQDLAELHKAGYLNAVQSALITAHNDPNFVGQALKLVAGEMQAETALLLTFDSAVIRNVYYWPSEDKSQAAALMGLDARDAFPGMFDALASKQSVFCAKENFADHLSLDAQAFFARFDIFNILLVPVADSAGILKGAIAAVNMGGSVQSPDMLECVTYDFFMAIANLESHNVIKKMGAIDYLTDVKNRNSFEAESVGYETLEGQSLWCMYVDANGLHELNNTQGHQAGDAMLCAVADAMKKIFGHSHTYRLGGDEFVSFRIDSSHDQLMNDKYRLLDALQRKGYSVSVGFECALKNENNIFDLETLMTQAEAIMYREKQKYYQQSGCSAERCAPAAEPC